MRTILILFYLFAYSVSAQNIENDTINKPIEVQEFQPDQKLLDARIWNRVSPNRFECSFLRLAVELRDFKYHLIEMDGNKRNLISSMNYKDISNAIVNLTLNERANLSGTKLEKFP